MSRGERREPYRSRVLSLSSLAGGTRCRVNAKKERDERAKVLSAFPINDYLDMSVHPRSDHEERSDSKRPRLDSETSCSAISLHPHLFTTRTGLFSVLAPTLGKKPAEEPQVGITEFIDSTSESFSGIIKHRLAPSLPSNFEQMKN